MPLNDRSEDCRPRQHVRKPHRTMVPRGVSNLTDEATSAVPAVLVGVWLRNWRRRPDLNRGWRFCRPLPYHLATVPNLARNEERAVKARACILEQAREVERETGFEPATSTLARSHSTTELFPLAQNA